MRQHQILSTPRPLAAILLLGLALGCTEPAPLADASPAALHPAQAQRPSAEAIDQLREIKEGTAKFRTLNAAIEAGYATDITGCLEDSALGGMGHHYANVAWLDATVDSRRPEALLYAPRPNGELQLVAIEYIVPFTAWTDPNPPELFGQVFHNNQTFQVWALHAWIWEENPAGLFADWNPRVGCP